MANVKEMKVVACVEGSVGGQVVFLGPWQVAHSTRVIGLSRVYGLYAFLG